MPLDLIISLLSLSETRNFQRFIKNRIGEELRFYHHVNQKAWTTSPIFEWMENFSTFISKPLGRIVNFLLHNAIIYDTTENIRLINDVRILSPPNITSALQAMNAAIITALEWRYHKSHCDQKLEAIDVNMHMNNVYFVDQLKKVRKVT